MAAAVLAAPEGGSAAMPMGSAATCPPPAGPAGPGSWSRSLDRALEEAAASGTLSLSGRKLRDYPRASAANHDLSDTTRAGERPDGMGWDGTGGWQRPAVPCPARPRGAEGRCGGTGRPVPASSEAVPAPEAMRRAVPLRSPPFVGARPGRVGVCRQEGSIPPCWWAFSLQFGVSEDGFYRGFLRHLLLADVVFASRLLVLVYVYVDIGVCVHTRTRTASRTPLPGVLKAELWALPAALLLVVWVRSSWRRARCVCPEHLCDIRLLVWV